MLVKKEMHKRATSPVKKKICQKNCKKKWFSEQKNTINYMRILGSKNAYPQNVDKLTFYFF